MPVVGKDPGDGQTLASVQVSLSLSHSRVSVYMFGTFARAYVHVCTCSGRVPPPPIPSTLGKSEASSLLPHGIQLVSHSMLLKFNFSPLALARSGSLLLSLELSCTLLLRCSLLLSVAL